MTNFASRLVVATVGLPLALGMLWLGGWWLFTLVAVAAVVAVHEFVTTARPLRPLGAAIYGGVLLALYDKRDEYLCVWQAIVLGLVVVIAAVLGDLFESALKRDLEVKDTGRLLGGHGGVLDRVDALLFAAPAAYFLVVSYGFR